MLPRIGVDAAQKDEEVVGAKAALALRFASRPLHSTFERKSKLTLSTWVRSGFGTLDDKQNNMPRITVNLR